MDGFGASITDSSAHMLYRLDRRRRDRVMRRLFEDNRLSVLRQPMGASDFVAGGFYTYDDLPAGRTDYDYDPLYPYGHGLSTRGGRH